MMDWSAVIDLTRILTTMLIGIMGTVVALILRDIEKWWRRYYIVFFSVIVASNLFGLFNYLRRRSIRCRRSISCTDALRIFAGAFICFIAPGYIMLLLIELMMFLDQGKQYLMQKEELSFQKASNAVLQMRPQFIYNTMTSIYYLIEQDSAKAQQITLDFTNYLRKNFTAIAKEGTIPFAEELEHTKAYLSVELARFEGKLFVDYDVSYMSFRPPPPVL